MPAVAWVLHPWSCPVPAASGPGLGEELPHFREYVVTVVEKQVVAGVADLADLAGSRLRREAVTC
jgi:hypothetical protein